MLEIVAAGFDLPRPLRGGARAADRRRVPGDPPVRATGSSTAAGAASRTGSRGATASSASAPRTRRVSAPGRAAALPGRRERDGAALPLRPLRFALEGGPLAGNHFATVVEGREHLRGARPAARSGKARSRSRSARCSAARKVAAAGGGQTAVNSRRKRRRSVCSHANLRRAGRVGHVHARRRLHRGCTPLAGGRCLGHLEPDQLDSVLAEWTAGGSLDGRGVIIANELLGHILEAAPPGARREPRALPNRLLVGDLRRQRRFREGDLRRRGPVRRGDLRRPRPVRGGDVRRQHPVLRGGLRRPPLVRGGDLRHWAVFAGATFSFIMPSSTWRPSAAIARSRGRPSAATSSISGGDLQPPIGGCQDDLHWRCPLRRRDVQRTDGFTLATVRGDADFSSATFETARQFGPMLVVGSCTLDDAAFLHATNILISAGRLSAHMGGVRGQHEPARSLGRDRSRPRRLPRPVDPLRLNGFVVDEEELDEAELIRQLPAERQGTATAAPDLAS